MATAERAVPRTARRAAWRDGTRLAVGDAPVPEPGPGQLLVRVRACGICGSDLHRFHAERPRPLPPGQGPGHEIAGEVAALGPGVEGPAVGTPVAPLAGDVCGACAYCRSGRYPLCPELKIAGAAWPGGMAEYFLANAAFAYPVPEGMPWTVAALTEPCAVALHGLKRARLERGMNVLVLGAGTIGLLAALVAADGGAAAVGVTARYPHQRAAAEAMGATDVYDPGEVTVGSAAARRDWDIVVETVGGTAPTLQQAVDVARPGGTVALLGVHTAPLPLDTRRLFFSELTVVGSLGYDRHGPRDDYEDTIALLAKERDRVAPLVTHTYPLEAVGEAYATALDKRSGAIKVAVLP